MKCPKCGCECERDSVHNGIAMLYGPWGCYNCGWSEDPYFDKSEGQSQAEKDYPDCVIDPLGIAFRKKRDVEF